MNVPHHSPGFATPSLPGVRILLVEDDPDARELLSMVLIQRHAEVRVVASAPEAPKALKRWKPDILVSDTGMPKVDGYELIRKVRSLAPEEGRDIPAIAITAYVGDQDRLRALSAGYQMHVPKPVEPAEFAAAVAALAAGEAGRV